MEYGRFETILADLHRIGADELKAFRSRIRVLRDMGVPAVVTAGKGSRASYSYSDVWIAHLALTFDRTGLPPIVITQISKHVSWEAMTAKLRSMIEIGHYNRVWLALTVIRDATFKGDDYNIDAKLLSDEELTAHLQLPPRDPQDLIVVHRPLTLLDLTALTNETQTVIRKHER